MLFTSLSSISVLIFIFLSLAGLFLLSGWSIYFLPISETSTDNFRYREVRERETGSHHYVALLGHPSCGLDERLLQRPHFHADCSCGVRTGPWAGWTPFRFHRPRNFLATILPSPHSVRQHEHMLNLIIHKYSRLSFCAPLIRFQCFSIGAFIPVLFLTYSIAYGTLCYYRTFLCSRTVRVLGFFYVWDV